LPRILSRSGLVLAGLLVAAGVAACGAAAAPPTVEVAYAGSLAYLMDQVVGPPAARAAHLTYVGRGGGSFALAQEIKAQTVPADVFFSVGTAPFAVIARRIPWTVTFATAPLVLAYNPKSRYAPTLKAVATGKEPFPTLFRVLASPGFRLGRTNPATDPQGRAFYLMAVLAQQVYGLPSDTVARTLGPPENPRQVFSETGILTQLQSGNLDAASAFLPEAVERHLAYVPLPSAIDFGNPTDALLYREASAVIPGVGRITGSLLTIAAAPIAGSGYRAGVRFLANALSGRFRPDWTRNGYRWMTFQYTGQLSRIPPAIRHESP
jgi:molybdate/tungstate transport system substrate-binding protein